MDGPDSGVPLPAVGGPAHGLLYGYDGSFFQMPGRIDPQDIGAPIHVTHSYRREHLRVACGALRLDGWVWIYNRLDREEVIGLAMGMLIGGLLGPAMK